MQDKRSSISKLRVSKELVSVLKNRVPAFKDMTSTVAIARAEIKMANGNKLWQREFEVKYVGGLAFRVEVVE